MKSWIDPALCVQAVKHFQESGHPAYRDIHIDYSYEPVVSMDDENEESLGGGGEFVCEMFCVDGSRCNKRFKD